MYMDIYFLPSEIINHIVYNYLPIRSIQSCLLTSKLFNVSSPYQLNILKNVCKGWKYCIRNGFLEEAKRVHKSNICKYDKFYIKCIYKSAFILSCHSGHLQVVQWLYQLSVDNKIPISISGGYNLIFQYTCGYGHLETAKWLYELSIKTNDKINIHADSESAFKYSCNGGHLETAKWLYELGITTKEPINIHIDDDVFKLVCINDYLEIAKWLYQISIENNDPININAVKSYLLKKPYLISSLKTKKWLQSLS